MKKQIVLVSFRIVLFVTVLLFNPKAYPGEHKPSEYQVKAAFLYNFAKFVKWPISQNDGVLILYILGDDPFGKTIDTIKGKSIRGEKIIIRYISNLKNLKNCNMLYISSSEKENIEQLVEALDGMSILTLGDTEGFAARGVMINLFIVDFKVRFEINYAASKNAGIVISSKILNLAKIVSF
ncbi:MAG: YfiR family protein [Planctomycetes bacterium]|nr:YfiR family protein [Planctomycetota bacterium]